MEGTVRRAEDTVRINVQLIDAETDEHLWTEIYDLQLTAQNVFAIQSDMAAAISRALHAVLSPREQSQISAVPTQSTSAFDFYLLGKDYFRRPDDPETLPIALEMFERAIEEDPEFALAYANLSHVHSRFHWVGLDRTDARLEMAAGAFRRAFELVPGLPEAHLAAGQYYYRGFADYERALTEYAMAERGMPGSAELAMSRAEAYRRFGKLRESLAYWEEAMALDPRNALLVFQAGNTALMQRNYELAERYARRGFELQPEEKFLANLIPLCRDGDVSGIVDEDINGWVRRLYERDYDGQLAYLTHWKEEARATQWFYLPRASVYGLTYRLAGEPALARSHFQAARIQVQEALAGNANDPFLHIALGEALAGLGEKEAAVRAADRAMKLRSTAADAMIGPAIRIDAVLRVLLPAGDHTKAIEELDAYLTGPGAWSIEGLLPDPRLDLIREDPLFQALVEKYKRR